MWVAVIFGFIIFRLFRCFFSGSDDKKEIEFSDLETESSDFNDIFSVSNRLEKLYGGKVYLGLRIPDPDTGTRRNIDIVLVTKEEVVVISVKNLAGFISINEDGSWKCEDPISLRAVSHPDPFAEAKEQVSILESYLEQRGVHIPEEYFSHKVVIPNPKFRTVDNKFPSEVITYDQWVQLKPGPKCFSFETAEPKSLFSGWIKSVFGGGKKEMLESFHQQLNFILSTAPMWDRLELKDNKYVLGELVEFKGNQVDVLALGNIKRSKFSRLIIKETSIFGIVLPFLEVLYSPRDYRSGGASSSERKQIFVRSSTEVIFQPQNSTKVGKLKLSLVTSMSLSA